jgi:hypothetical protein
MDIKLIGKIKCGQDGAIYNSELFRFDNRGNCTVYNLSSLNENEFCELKPIAEFTLDRADVLAPHSNAVCFGCEFYEEGDEYPLLYTNIYNNYAKEEDRLIGVCCVYRIQRIGTELKSTLVQLIEIGFCEDPSLWKAHPDGHSIRPYGNFVIDTSRRMYHGFVMRSESLGTRYFSFDLPSVTDGETDARFNVKKVILKDADIREYFDCEYHRFIQGAIVHDEKIYSTEGFHNDEINRPAIRIIDLRTKKEQYFDIMSLGFIDEPEFIDFYENTCLYSDYDGNLYTVDFFKS